MFSHKTLIRISYVCVLILSFLATFGLSILLQSKEYVFQQIPVVTTVTDEIEPFPVSVNPLTQTILEDTAFDSIDDESLAVAESTDSKWWKTIVAFFSDKDWYQNLASPISRIIVIWPGERREEAVDNIGDILTWDEEERAEFSRIITTTEPVLNDGTFYPGEYVAHRGARPDEIALMITEQFNAEILSRYTPEVEQIVPLHDALVIASLLEREASDFDNMREISGVIWNRLFINMPLQLDATLQYARGSRPNEAKWWPVPRPSDKFLDSPYNTYSNKGLPPAPISNPSAEAVIAALNPRPTECLYYFHDSKQGYHCSASYEEHVAKLKQQYGRGK